MVQRGPGGLTDALEALLARAAAAGATCLPLTGLPPEAVAALPAAADAGTVLVDETTVALEHWAMVEDALADGVARLLASAAPLERPASALEGAPARAVERALAEGVSTVVGGPGTGGERVVAALEAAGAVVLSGATRGPLLPEHHEGRQLETGLVVVTDAQRLDVDSATALVEALADGVHLVLVGDPEQLPPPGPGRVLADLAESRVVPATALGRLVEPRPLTRFAAAVRTGELPPADDPSREVVLVPTSSLEETAHRVRQLVHDSVPRAFGVASDEVLVLAAGGAEELARLLGRPVLPVADAVGRHADAVVLAVPPGGVAGLDRALVLSTCAAARRHLSIVNGVGRVLDSAVAGEPAVRPTRLAALLRAALAD